MDLSNLFSQSKALAQGLTQAAQTPNAVILDVRTRDEYAQGHVPGSLNIPLDRIAAEMRNIPKTAPLFVYCHSGTRAGYACNMLQNMGYTAQNIGGVAGYTGTLTREA